MLLNQLHASEINSRRREVICRSRKIINNNNESMDLKDDSFTDMSGIPALLSFLQTEPDDFNEPKMFPTLQ